jgi:hypothetical protein
MSESEQERNNPPTPEQLKAAEERWQKMYEDGLVAKAIRFERLARRILSRDVELPPGFSDDFSPADVRHLAEMLLLLDIARGSSFTRFRSRYAGNTEYGL